MPAPGQRIGADEAEALEDALEADFEAGEVIRSEIIPEARRRESNSTDV